MQSRLIYLNLMQQYLTLAINQLVKNNSNTFNLLNAPATHHS